MFPQQFARWYLSEFLVFTPLLSICLSLSLSSESKITLLRINTKIIFLYCIFMIASVLNKWFRWEFNITNHIFLFHILKAMIVNAFRTKCKCVIIAGALAHRVGTSFKAAGHWAGITLAASLINVDSLIYRKINVLEYYMHNYSRAPSLMHLRLSFNSTKHTIWQSSNSFFTLDISLLASQFKSWKMREWQRFSSRRSYFCYILPEIAYLW